LPYKSKIVLDDKMFLTYNNLVLQNQLFFKIHYYSGGYCQHTFSEPGVAKIKQAECTFSTWALRLLAYDTAMKDVGRIVTKISDIGVL